MTVIATRATSTSGLTERSAADSALNRLAELAGNCGTTNQLRRGIYDLAVRGLLVPQSPSDGTGRSVLASIKDKATAPLEGNGGEEPFELPASWAWGTLGSVCSDVHYGFTASADKARREVLLLRITDIQNDAVDWSTVPGCSIAKAAVDKYRLAEGDLLIARTGGTIGKTFLVPARPPCAVFASYLIRAIPIVPMYPAFLKLFSCSSLYWRQLVAGSAGTGQPNVNATTLKSLLMPIPPVAEQKRIVAKVDQLMALCDELEVRQTKKRETGTKLTQSALDALTSAEGPEEFAKAWQRVADNFQVLLNTPESIGEVRKTILELAVQGKLVRQDPRDTPVSIPPQAISQEARRTSLPSAWQSTCLGAVARDLQNGISKRKGENGKPVPVIRLADIVRGQLKDTSLRDILLTEKEIEKYKILPDDILVIRVNGSVDLVGRFVPCKANKLWAYSDHLIRIRLHPRTIVPDYLCIYANTPTARKHIISKAVTTAGQKTINQSGLGSLVINVPPLAEQKRIVAKVDQLLALCDTLESKLRDAEQGAQRLAEAMVAEMVA